MLCFNCIFVIDATAKHLISIIEVSLNAAERGNLKAELKDQTNKKFEEAQGQNERGAKLFLRTVTVSGAGVLHLADIPIMCLRVCNDIDAVIWVKNA